MYTSFVSNSWWGCSIPSLLPAKRTKFCVRTEKTQQMLQAFIFNLHTGTKVEKMQEDLLRPLQQKLVWVMMRSQVLVIPNSCSTLTINWSSSVNQNKLPVYYWSTDWSLGIWEWVGKADNWEKNQTEQAWYGIRWSFISHLHKYHSRYPVSAQEGHLYTTKSAPAPVLRDLTLITDNTSATKQRIISKAHLLASFQQTPQVTHSQAPF